MFGGLRLGLSLLCMLAVSSCGAVRFPKNTHADIPNEPVTDGGMWPSDLPENTKMSASVEAGELVWTVEPITREDWSSSRWLFADVEQELERNNGVYAHCDTALPPFKLLRKTAHDDCDRKMGEWYRGFGDLRLEQFTLRSESIEFVGHCGDWNASRLFQPIDYRCQAKGIALGSGANEGMTYHIILRFPLELLADIPLGPVG